MSKLRMFYSTAVWSTIFRPGSMGQSKKAGAAALLSLVYATAPLAAGSFVSPILDAGYGYNLGVFSGSDVWWCESTYKVGRERPCPTNTAAAVEISCARNEVEAFQLVIRPYEPKEFVIVAVSDFLREGSSRDRIAATNVEIFMVEYVPVTVLTDPSVGSTVGDYPDPLPPLMQPFGLPQTVNQPIWISVYVPKETPPGIYTSMITVDGDLSFTIPIRLTVYSFALPDTTHTRTAYHVEVNSTWHKPENLAQRREIWDLYMQNFRRHRVSPYAAHYYSPLAWSITNTTTGEFEIDFTEFDRALSRYIDEFGFNGFNLFGHKSPPFPTGLGGHEAFTLEYRKRLSALMRPIMLHLRQRGWMDEAYCYWIDEPTTNSFPRVLNGMRALQECAPGLKRLLTLNQYPTAEWDGLLNGNVDIWVPIIYIHQGYKPRFEDRRYSGEEIWNYVCMAPRGTFPNNFIDLPAIYHRVRFWLMQKDRITGDLYWAANYWLGRNPWTNTWSFANGDGTLLYPPVKTEPTDAVVAGPINSLRWELIREGLEDSEYFWLLKLALAKGQAALGVDHPAVVEGHAALRSAFDLIPTASAFENDPQQMFDCRERMAQSIQELDDGRPFIVAGPVSRCVRQGETVWLRADVIGWPPLSYQWSLNGTPLPGATNSALILEDFQASDIGSYRVRVSNFTGGSVSAQATLAILEASGPIRPPRILVGPESQVRRIGDAAVLSVTVADAAQAEYRWVHENTILSDQTNSILVLTNLQASSAGKYYAMVRNPEGTGISAPAAVVLDRSPNLSVSIQTNATGRMVSYAAYQHPTRVLISSNLVHWEDWIQPAWYGDPINLLDTDTRLKARYYRVVVP